MTERTRRRLVVVQVLILSLVVTLAGRLWQLQVGSGDRYARAATENLVREVVEPATRGLILDSAGRPLVANRSTLVVSVDRSVLDRQPDQGAAVLARLARLLRVDRTELANRVRLCRPGVGRPCWNGSPYRPVPVASDVDKRVALQVLERAEDYPGITAQLELVRDYPRPAGTNAAHLLGYLGPVTEAEAARSDVLGLRDLVGRAGLERQYDRYLRGTPGTRYVAVDHLGRVVQTLSETSQVPGSHLVTTIDARVQRVAEQALREAMHRARTIPDYKDRLFKGDSGSVVVMDVTDGSIIAMASWPTYDPTVWVGGISSAEYRRLTSEKAGYPLVGQAFQGGAPPGSTFKPISAAGAAKAGYNLDSGYGCTSSFQVGNRAFKNFDSLAYGPITVAQALQVSCDTVFYRLAYDMWIKDGGSRPVPHPKDPMFSMAREFGFGKQTGIDLPNESPGRVPDRTWKLAYWRATKDELCRRGRTGYPELARTDPARAAFLTRFAAESCTRGYQLHAYDAVNFSIGQGDLMLTPLQLVRAYAAIANGGTLWRPRIGKAIIGPDGKVIKKLAPKKLGRVDVPPAAMRYIREALVGTAVSGTASGVFSGWPLNDYPIGSKTGTAEIFGKQPRSWFAAFGPDNNPRYAIVMTVSQGGTGSGTSGPSVRKIFEALLGLGEYQHPMLADGRPPAALPKMRRDGSFAPPIRRAR
ncbi:MAG TPA: penicillin-binding protein 2 [Actinomycetes bacterium]|nr:penicillin-binding protein 2 [Actinomycetes bacterium]